MTFIGSLFLVGLNYSPLTTPFITSLLVTIISFLLFGLIFNLYRKVWEYASIPELIIIFKVVTYTVAIGSLFQFIFTGNLNVRFQLVTMAFLLLFIGGSRFIWRVYRDTFLNKNTKKLRTLIIGAGSAGTMVARQLQKSNESSLLPVGFIDDDENKQHLDILGIPIVGGTKGITKNVQSLNIEHIIIAIPSLNKKKLNEIFQECAKTNVKTKILPLIEDLVTGKITVNECRDVELEDLLMRDPIHLNMESIAEHLTGKTILVTGAGGSIGSEIVRQIILFHPSKLVLLGHGENSIYSIEMECNDKHMNKNIQYVTEIADIQDEEKMLNVMDLHKPHVVYHAAAHKHVPLMERNPEEAIKNNIIGTMNVANAAEKNGVETFVMVSTDKAVYPTSVMGASKKLAEMVVQRMDRESKTKFVTVRFGNVLGSQGSIIPLFKKQIEQGGPVTITHPKMIRYFMTIPEASKLVIQAGSLANGGEIFVLDMGEPVKIIDLAKNLIKLSGFTTEEIGLEFTGIRPGEKLFEELMTKEERIDKQLYPNIYIGKTSHLYWDDLEHFIRTFSSMDKRSMTESLLYLANHGVGLREKEAVSIPN